MASAAAPSEAAEAVAELRAKYQQHKETRLCSRVSFAEEEKELCILLFCRNTCKIKLCVLLKMQEIALQMIDISSVFRYGKEQYQHDDVSGGESHDDL